MFVICREIRCFIFSLQVAWVRQRSWFQSNLGHLAEHGTEVVGRLDLFSSIYLGSPIRVRHKTNV